MHIFLTSPFSKFSDLTTLDHKLKIRLIRLFSTSCHHHYDMKITTLVCLPHPKYGKRLCLTHIWHIIELDRQSMPFFLIASLLITTITCRNYKFLTNDCTTTVNKLFTETEGLHTINYIETNLNISSRDFINKEQTSDHIHALQQTEVRINNEIASA